MKKLFVLLLLLAAVHFSNAQFVKSYQIQPQQNLTFNCISKSLTGTYFIAGIVDTSVYVAEVDQLGNKIREKLIGVGNKAYNLTSMITDADGNIVIVGSISLALTNTKSFLMKISPALSLLLHRKYEDITQNGSTVHFTDIKEFTSTGDYYISGLTRNYTNNTAADVLLVTVNRNTGTVTNTFSGGRGEDGYDALVLVPKNTRPVTTSIFATGRLSTGGTATFRPWINAHNSSLAFTGAGAQYLRPTNTTARLYSSSLIADYNNFIGNIPNLVYCWQGDLNSTGFGIHIGMGSYLSSTLNPNWQKQYVVTTPPAAKQILLNKVAADVNGYVAEGNWWDGVTTSTDNAIAGEMFFLRTDKGGSPLWSRRLDKVFVNQRSHNSGMLIDTYQGHDVIYAVGFRTANTGVTEGVLVQMPITGAMDTVCAPIQTAVAKTWDYATIDKINTLPIAMKDTIRYYPVDCVITKDSVSCDSNCAPPDLQSADFELTGVIHIGNTSTFDVTASSFNITQNSQWIVSDITSGTSVNVESDPAGGAWSPITASTQFNGYYLLGSHYGPTIGQFQQLHKYRFQHILSQTNNCAITYSDTVTKVIYMCTSCRTTKGVFIVDTEKKTSTASGTSSIENKAGNAAGKTIVYPNPANGTINFNLSALQVTNPVLQILNADGQVMKTVKVNSNTDFKVATSSWSSGTYLYHVIAGGSIINKGNFVVSH